MKNLTALMYKPWLAIILSVISLAACAGPVTNASSPNETEMLLLEQTGAYNLAWEALDLERIQMFHAEDLKYYYRGALGSSNKQEFADLFKTDVSSQIIGYSAKVIDPVVKILGPDAGMVSFIFDGDVITPDGTKVTYDGALTYVFERRNGKWLVVHIHESAPVDESE